jgi:hypothetical protein
MKSPFPGMDPYLERHWGDVHQRMMTYICDWLQVRLPGDLRARMQERVYVELPTESYVEIVDVKSGHRIVTTVEVLSPTNKRPSEGQELFLQKRADMKQAGVNIVEIDLLRGGQRVLFAAPELVPPSHRTAYQICVWRAAQRRQVEVYRVPLRERLPVFRVPLRPTDRDALIDLQAIIDQCYRNGGYDDIDYLGEPDPALSAADRDWADQLLREQGRR